MPRLELRHLSKSYPSVQAIDRVSLCVQPGEIHALLGENGAGKSTLMKMVFGMLQPDQGEIFWNGQAVRVSSPRHARQLGLHMLFQNFSLFNNLSAAQNVLLGLDRRYTLTEVTRRMHELGEAHGFALNPSQPVHALSMGERQQLEMLRALITQPQCLILDEPTSALTPDSIEPLFSTLRKWAQAGVSIIYISHKLAEVRALCDRCTVLRGGKVVAEVDPRLESIASLARHMLGGDPPPLQKRRIQPSEVIFRVQSLCLPSITPLGVDLTQLQFHLQAGEIVGVAGVPGQGQSELLNALTGEDDRLPAGAVFLRGQDLRQQSPLQRRQKGLRFVPEARLGRGLLGTLTLAANVLLTRTSVVNRRWGWVRKAATRALAQKIIQRFHVQGATSDTPAHSLSGGNQQRFMVGREIDAHPRVLMLHQPTGGVDVSASAHLHNALLALRDNGCAVLVVSTDLDELRALCDRLVVMAHGRMSPSLPIAQATTETLGRWMEGLWPAPPSPPARHAQA